MSKRTPNTNEAHIRFWLNEGEPILVCDECGETVLRVNSGERMDMVTSYVKDHIRACVGHPSGVHYLDRG